MCVIYIVLSHLSENETFLQIPKRNSSLTKSLTANLQSWLNPRILQVYKKLHVAKIWILHQRGENPTDSAERFSASDQAEVKRMPFEFHFFFVRAIQTERVDEARSEGQESEKMQWFLKCFARTCSVVFRISPIAARIVLGDPITAGHATCVSYLCSRDRPRHLNQPFEYEYASGTGVAREIVPPSLTFKRARAIDDQVVRQVSAISTEGANLTFNDNYEIGGLRPDRCTRKTYVASRWKPPTKTFTVKRKRRTIFFR